MCSCADVATDRVQGSDSKATSAEEWASGGDEWEGEFVNRIRRAEAPNRLSWRRRRNLRQPLTETAKMAERGKNFHRLLAVHPFLLKMRTTRWMTPVYVHPTRDFGPFWAQSYWHNGNGPGPYYAEAAQMFSSSQCWSWLWKPSTSRFGPRTELVKFRIGLESARNRGANGSGPIPPSIRWNRSYFWFRLPTVKKKRKIWRYLNKKLSKYS